jgi:hypothetical protein
MNWRAPLLPVSSENILQVMLSLHIVNVTTQRVCNDTAAACGVGCFRALAGAGAARRACWLLSPQIMCVRMRVRKVKGRCLLRKHLVRGAGRDAPFDALPKASHVTLSPVVPGWMRAGDNC